MATKAECLNLAAEYTAQAAKSIDHAAAMAVVFGGSDPVAVAAFEEVRRLHDTAHNWRRLASLHPQTRAAEIRTWAK